MRSIKRLWLWLLPLLFLPTLFPLGVSQNVSALTADEELSQARDLCEDRTLRMVREERDVYRRVQYTAGLEKSVLGTPTARTSDLVPYLTLNYHALSCRLRSICDAVEISPGHLDEQTSVLPHRPIGCSRLFAARGRWWDDARRPEGVDLSVIEECRYGDLQKDAEGFEVTPDYLGVGIACRSWVEQILLEERQLLRLLVAEDTTQRGTRQVIGVFQAVLQDIRDSFLEPLRGMVDLFGSIIHPIPCLLTQCN